MGKSHQKLRKLISMLSEYKKQELENFSTPVVTLPHSSSPSAKIIVGFGKIKRNMFGI